MAPPSVHVNLRFLDRPERLFSFLRISVAWDERMKARKTASFGQAYNYSQIAYAPAPMPAELAAVCRQVEAELGFAPNNCLLNYYADGSSSMGFHSDSSEALAAETGVAIVSLGDTRSIVFRSKKDRSAEFAYALPAGSLLYMAQSVQDHWLHAIPRTAQAGERISLTFRAMVKPA